MSVFPRAMAGGDGGRAVGMGHGFRGKNHNEKESEFKSIPLNSYSPGFLSGFPSRTVWQLSLLKGKFSTFNNPRVANHA